MRNGRLNQTAYSFRLFVRDVCADDLVGWIDRQLSEADSPPARDRVLRLGRAVIDPMKGVFGASDKVLSMVLSEMLIGADAGPAFVGRGRRRDDRHPTGSFTTGSTELGCWGPLAPSISTGTAATGPRAARLCCDGSRARSTRADSTLTTPR